MSHGLPLPSCVTFKRARAAAGQGRLAIATRRLRASARPVDRRRARRRRSTVATVRPATCCDSNFAANLSSASEPHRLAVVVSQAPRRWRASAPTTMRGMSSFQAGSSSTARISRAALASALSISHHQKSSLLGAELQRRAGVGQARAQDLLRFVEALRRARECRRRASGCCSQSITAAVGQRFGVRLIEPSIFGCARP